MEKHWKTENRKLQLSTLMWLLVEYNLRQFWLETPTTWVSTHWPVSLKAPPAGLEQLCRNWLTHNFFVCICFLGFHPSILIHFSVCSTINVVMPFSACHSFAPCSSCSTKLSRFSLVYLRLFAPTEAFCLAVVLCLTVWRLPFSNDDFLMNVTPDNWPALCDVNTGTDE